METIDQSPDESGQSPDLNVSDPALDPEIAEMGLRLAAGVREFVDQRDDPPDGSELVRFFASILNEGDRALPIVCFSYLDAAMERLLRRAMWFPEHNDRLFGTFGPLSTADARIGLAYAMGWIDEVLRDELLLLKRIRNDFAHEFIEAGLEDARVGSRLREHSGVKGWGPTEKITGGTTRGLYLFAFALTAWKLLGQLFVLPALRHLILADAESVMSQEGAYRPNVLHDLDVAHSRMLWLLIYTHGNEGGREMSRELIREFGDHLGIDVPPDEDWDEDELLRMMRRFGLEDL